MAGDGRRVFGSPEQRPTSSMASALNMSLFPYSTSLHTPESSPVSSASDYYSSLFLPDNESDEIWRDISPYECTVCEILAKAIRTCGDKAHVEQHPQHALPDYRPESLAAALSHAASAIRFNAKWFAPTSLSTLLEVALDAVGATSSSAELHAGLVLINNVVTYTMIPVDRVSHAARFLAYAYHQGSRSNRTKKLSDEAWAILVRILQSHLGAQLLDEFLNIIHEYAATADHRTEYASSQGSIHIVRQILFSPRKDIPDVNLVGLLESVRVASTAENNMLHEPISEILVGILDDPSMIDRITRYGGWDDLLVATDRCLRGKMISAKLSNALIDAISQRLSNLETRSLSSVARLFILFERPLTPAMGKELSAECVKLFTSTQTLVDFWHFIDQLHTCDKYDSVLNDIVSKGLNFVLNCESDLLFTRFVEECTSRLKHAAESSRRPLVSLGEHLVQAFERCLEEDLRQHRRDELFSAIAATMNYDTCCMRLLFRLRADVEGQIFLRSDSHSSSNEGSSRPSILHSIHDLPLREFFTALVQGMEGRVEIWDPYDLLLTNIAHLIGNRSMFEGNLAVITDLRAAVCKQLDAGLLKFVRNDAKTSVTSRLLNLLTILISYHRHLKREDMVQIIGVFIKHAGAGDTGCSVYCVHGLTISCYEVPDFMSSHMDSVIDKMSKMVTQRPVAIHVLQFLAGLSRLPDLYRNFRQLDYKRIFAVCQSYLQSTRKTDDKMVTATAASSVSTASTVEDALPEYVYALAHHVVTFWYIAMSPHDRAGLKPYIKNFLSWRDLDGKEKLEDQGIVTVDMMDRIDAEEESEAGVTDFDHSEGRILMQMRLVGLLLVTTKTSLRSGKTVVHVRRPSGNSWHVIDPSKPSDANKSSSPAKITLESTAENAMTVLNGDSEGCVYGQVAIPESTSILGSADMITLPQDDGARRAIESLDRTPALDSHKTGVIYIGEGQKTEDEILRNSSGSPDYRDFVNDLGTLQLLKGAKFNTQGLDRADNYDGEHTVVWNNKVTEIVYHITTLMPTSDDVRENTARKKRHIGNDFVNIVFNNSGSQLTYDTLYNIFPSDFGYVYIVITPASRTTFIQARTGPVRDKSDRFYSVKVLMQPDYPSISPAAEEKIVSGASLAGFVRNLALNDCIVSLMKSPRGDAGEYPSSWRNRMDQIRRIASRYGGQT